MIFHKHSCVIYLKTKEELEAHRVINTASAFFSTYWKVFKNIVQIKYFRKIDKICAEFYKFFSGIKIDWNCFWQYVLTCILRIGCLSHEISWWYCFGVSSEVSLEFLQLNQKIKNIYYCTWLLLLLHMITIIIAITQPDLCLGQPSSNLCSIPRWKIANN